MEERIRPTKSGLFAIELLIAVGIFSLCAAICMGLFVRSEVMSQEAADLNRAVSAARSAAECYKAAGGDLEKTAELTGGGVLDAGTLFIEFDESWQPLSAGEAGVFQVGHNGLIFLQTVKGIENLQQAVGGQVLGQV